MLIPCVTVVTVYLLSVRGLDEHDTRGYWNNHIGLYDTLPPSCQVVLTGFTAHQRSGEGSVFSRVCLLIGGGVPVQGPGPVNPLYITPASLPLPPVCKAPTLPPDMVELVYYEARTVGKRAVCIRLKCLPVPNVFDSHAQIPVNAKCFTM